MRVQNETPVEQLYLPLTRLQFAPWLPANAFDSTTLTRFLHATDSPLPLQPLPRVITSRSLDATEWIARSYSWRIRYDGHTFRYRGLCAFAKKYWTQRLQWFMKLLKEMQAESYLSELDPVDGKTRRRPLSRLCLVSNSTRSLEV